VFLWIGQCVDPKEKQNAFEIGQVKRVWYLWFPCSLLLQVIDLSLKLCLRNT
jgi:hypothetical protein